MNYREDYDYEHENYYRVYPEDIDTEDIIYPDDALVVATESLLCKDLRFSFIDFYDEEVGVYFYDCPEKIYEIDISSCENMQDAIDEIYYTIETEYRRRGYK